MLENNKPKGAFSIIISEGHVFMVQEKDKTWGFIGGTVEEGETSLQASLREALEESDGHVNLHKEEIVAILDLSNKPNFIVVGFVYDDFIYNEKPKYREKFQSQANLQNGETLQTKWVSFEDFKKIKLRKPLQRKKMNLYNFFKGTYED